MRVKAQRSASTRSSASASRFSAGRGGAPKRSSEFLAEVGQAFDAMHPAKAAVQFHLQLRTGNIIARQVGTPGKFDRAIIFRLLGLAGRRAHGRFQQRAVKLIADALDMAGLFGAENIPRAANLQVAERDLEPAPRSVNSSIAFNRLTAFGVTGRSDSRSK